MKSDEITYGSVARAFHWSIAVLILCLIASGYLSDFLPKGSFVLHKATGILVLGLTVLRLLWWMADRQRPGDAELTWEKWPSRLVKWALLTLGVAMPLTGWIMSSAAARPFTFYGLFDVPMVTGPDKAVAGTFFEAHETLALVLVIILAMHVAGALRHHFLLQDGILRRMLPGLGHR